MIAPVGFAHFFAALVCGWWLVRRCAVPPGLRQAVAWLDRSRLCPWWDARAGLKIGLVAACDVVVAWWLVRPNRSLTLGAVVRGAALLLRARESASGYPVGLEYWIVGLTCGLGARGGHSAI